MPDKLSGCLYASYTSQLAVECLCNRSHNPWIARKDGLFRSFNEVLRACLQRGDPLPCQRELHRLAECRLGWI